MMSLRLWRRAALGPAAMLAAALLVVGCRHAGPVAPATPEITPYDATDARQSPFTGATAGSKPTALPELASVRFQNGIRVGMNISQLETLAGKRGTLRLLVDGKQEWTVAWPDQGTGFRVQLRDGRTVAWMQASAMAVE